LVEAPEDGRIKLHVIRTALAVRRDHPDLFTTGDYVPLPVEGPAKRHVLAFARTSGTLRETSAATPGASSHGAGRAAVTVVPRLTTTPVPQPAAAPIGPAVWSDTVICLPESLRHQAWTCALTGEQVTAAADGQLKVAQLMSSFPVALLINEL
jgi:(1->4)-alpha-D-glucan 1-alpha-D-glucosylmutase